MKIMIDTNVIIDVYQNREPFANSSAALLKLSESGKVIGHVTTSMVTDIYYILGRHIKDTEQRKQLVQKFLTTVTLVDVLAKDVSAAFGSPMPDFEDALVSQCAKRIRADYVVTRNTKDFKQSSVPALTPDEFLNKFFPT